jgi:CheY-like chemotaxis protein
VAQGRVVLLVEDDDQVRAVASQILTTHGYEVLAAREAGDALLQLAAHRGPVQLLLTDIVMPGMNGRQLAEHVRQLRPDIRVLFTSGYAGDAIMQRGVVQANAAFLAKPYSADSLLRKVSEVLAT